MKKVRIGGMMHSSGLAMVGVLAMPSRPGLAGKILSTLGEHSINVPFIVQIVDQDGHDHVVFCVSSPDLSATLELLQDVRHEVQAKEVVHETNVGTVSIFGPDFRQRPGIAGQMFAALGRVGINIKAISTSMSTITCVVQGDRIRDALKALEETFEFPC
ncbi:MAG: ACT domain-containing protein [Anaerolineae bacterium]|nr:ACT domain-containing protein [Anaerolineae bacterium]MDW8070781.1 ACT domain-containing protein [Anaerolineae bacterium]